MFNKKNTENWIDETKSFKLDNIIYMMCSMDTWILNKFCQTNTWKMTEN